MDLNEFAKMHADSVVMADLGGPISKEKSRTKLAKYMSMYDRFGYSRYCVEDHKGRFVGYVGICPQDGDQAIGAHNEIGWRLNAAYWGEGYASEAGHACLSEFQSVFPNVEVISYTTAENSRSQKVMGRLKMKRVYERDFDWVGPDGTNTPLLVWAASQP